MDTTEYYNRLKTIRDTDDDTDEVLALNELYLDSNRKV